MPFLAFGPLLGAVRSGSMIPFTEDADIGYVGEMITPDALRLALQRKGYHMFIWRVCVAPTNPLAGHLYDPNLPITRNFAVPYVDLYKMEQTDNGDWNLEGLEGSNGSSILPGSKVQPFSQVMINGMKFDTVKDPRFFLQNYVLNFLMREAYGDDYMIPKPRSPQLSSDVN
ncbi:unnamed protein product [Phytophthora lilii]|uniref:Unnamed protein product n=1 Tax=Phytophthora lilii TaxID=2077276 RepID=A0A9W6TD92_9STRA|nr:unnamed protein product [Phytophthora lilii]